MAHLFNDFFKRDLAISAKFKHCNQRMLDKWSTRRRFEIGLIFLFERMGGMVGRDYIDTIIG